MDKGDGDAGWIISCVKRKQALATGIARACFLFVVQGRNRTADTRIFDSPSGLIWL